MANQKPPFSLPDLPYAKDALSPHISSNTLDFHHGKHHAAYVNKLNDLVKGNKFEGKSLEEIIKSADPQSDAGVFNNAAQVWNHTFFWHCMKPKAGHAPTGKLGEMINASFGSFDKFKTEFKDAAVSQFGSGWAWLVLKDGKLAITKTSNAINPMSQKQEALFTVDVWEHAYYLDFQNRRPDFVGAVLDNLANWDFVSENLAKVMK